MRASTSSPGPVFAYLALLLFACEKGPVATSQNTVSEIDPPAAPGAFAPALWGDDEGLLMTWLEPLGETREEGHRVRFAGFEEGRWSEPATVVEGTDLFANWADYPAPARDAEGDIVVHWLAKTAPETYAYSIYLAGSRDRGRTWDSLGKLHQDGTHTEHGFVSWTREPAGGLRAFWLDGREMATGGPMTLRTAAVDLGAQAPVRAEAVVDERVCECCSTDAVTVGGESIVAYRDRGVDEVRDIRLGVVGGEVRTLPVVDDGWRIEGCPVNGPAIAADDGLLTAAWFTAPDERPKVVAAISRDGGQSFSTVTTVDDHQPLGRVDLAPLDGGSVAIAWFARTGDEAAVKLAQLGSDGSLGTVRELGRTAMSRASGFPRLARVDESLVVAWVEIVGDQPSRTRVLRLPKDAI